jgi:hypothetical protein
MKTKNRIVPFFVISGVSFAVTAIVTFLWNFAFHGACAVDWETSFRFAVIFGIVLTWMETRSKKVK